MGKKAKRKNKKHQTKDTKLQQQTSVSEVDNAERSEKVLIHRRFSGSGNTCMEMVGLFVLVLPLLLFMIYQIKNPAPNGIFSLLGIVGCFVMGIGLFNIVAIFVKEYLGVLLGIFYFIFRWNLEKPYKEKRARAKKVRGLMKGFKNYWWYEALHKEFNLGWYYKFNKCFTVCFAVAAILHIGFGWLKVVVLLIVALFVLLAFMSTVINWFWIKEHNKETYGTPFIIIRLRPSGHGPGWFDSCIEQGFLILFSLVLVYIEFSLMYRFL